jgi:hypothetical protein
MPGKLLLMMLIKKLLLQWFRGTGNNRMLSFFCHLPGIEG